LIILTSVFVLSAAVELLCFELNMHSFVSGISFVRISDLENLTELTL